LDRIARESDVTMKIAALMAVSLLKSVLAPRAPKTV
jgi:hypothetical protein